MQVEDLLRRIAAQDRQSFAALFRALQAPMTRYAAAILAGDVEAAADAVDEAFLDIWRQADRFEGLGAAAAEAWIRRIVRNKAVDWLRHRRERTHASQDEQDAAEQLRDEGDTPEQAAEKKSAADELRRVLARLSPEHREAVWLCYFEDRTISEIAAIAGCPENTVKTRLFHARRQMRTLLEPQASDEGLG